MKRIAYSWVKEDLSNPHITLVIGARQVGKTTLLHQLKSDLEKKRAVVDFINLENKQYLKLLNQSVENLFQLIQPPQRNAKNYVFIDEVQYLDDPSNVLKHIYDEYHSKIKLVVSGSSSFYIDKKFKDSLAGRKRIFELYPLSFMEMLLFNGQSNFAKALYSGSIPLVPKNQIEKYFFEYLTYGGYPAVVLAKTRKDKILILKELVESYAKKDALEANLKKPESYLNLMKLLSDRIGDLLNITNLATDCGLDQKTLEQYLWVLKKSFYIRLITPFFNNLSSELTKMPKLYFNDLGIRNFLLGNLSPIGMRNDRGDILENYFYTLFRDIPEFESIHFWRTQKKQEVDFVVGDLMGNWRAYEVKYSQKSFMPKKYKYFQTSYPNIPLECVELNQGFELDLHSLFDTF